ncbi:hypothetical protein BC936DRAFT_141656 [Jimgerdemannia flammicorona]|uniref:Uncharacterized protein n=1 Tax=Jimgerdemannia flammicorona TaxID=994334 RepID=A0A433A1U9_9FUNG|nr:hypothetical protein BC936DRAFT_141656 [Jimgerdemannia flammicorona]
MTGLASSSLSGRYAACAAESGRCVQRDASRISRAGRWAPAHLVDSRPPHRPLPARVPEAHRRTMLSISKLAFLATVEYDELNNEDIHTIQEEIDDKLDVLTINSQLMQVFQNELKDGGPSLLDGKVKVVVDSLAAALKAHEKFAFEELFSQLVKVLLVGNSILGEDLIDALTLKNNHKCAVDYLYAIEVYRRAKDLPEARREAALKTAWRRTFLHDEHREGIPPETERVLLHEPPGRPPRAIPRHARSPVGHARE